MYHISCIHSSVEGHLGSFQHLAIINKAAMNIVGHVSLLQVGTSSGYMPRRGIAGSSSRTMFNILRNHHTISRVVVPACSWNLEEKVGKSLQHMGLGEKFLNRTPMVYALRSTIYKWDLMKLKRFCKAKDTRIGHNSNLQIGKISLPHIQ